MSRHTWSWTDLVEKSIGRYQQSYVRKEKERLLSACCELGISHLTVGLGAATKVPGAPSSLLKLTCSIRWSLIPGWSFIPTLRLAPNAERLFRHLFFRRGFSVVQLFSEEGMDSVLTSSWLQQ